jgi:UTP--glucose-1-phosphate uridylyltransferase
MLPIVDTPTIQLIVEEAVAAGIEEIVLVNGRGKGSIEDHFDHAYELEHTLSSRGKKELADAMAKISSMVRLVSVRQKQPNGLGHAVLVAREAIGDEPFAVLLGDDLYDAKRPAIGQLIDVYAQTGKGACAVMEVPPGQEHLYGVVSPGKRLDASRVEVVDMVEKPAPGTAPSRLAIVGRYVLPASIWPILAETKPGKGGEIQLTDAIRAVIREGGRAYGVRLRPGERRYDIGNFEAYFEAFVAFALADPKFGPSLRRHLLDLLHVSHA